MCLHRPTVFQFTALLLALTLPALGLAEQCPATANIGNPLPFVWEPIGGEDPHYVGTLEISEATLSVGDETITTRVYRQEDRCDNIPGPTLRMTAGNKYVLRFRNKLDYEPASEEHNVFKDPNVSNLHTHGLHISGESPGDDVTRSFEGQAGGDFVYEIPDDHMSGTYWYHAHHHGSTFLQVSAGAFGLIVIDNPALDALVPASVKDMQQRELVVAYLDPSVAGTGGDTLITGTLAPTWTVNGQVNGTLQVQRDTWQHWRVLLADRDARLKTLRVGGACEAVLMARDGVWRTEVPKALPTGSINLTGASRADLGVRCSGSGSLSVGSQVVASIAVAGTANTGPSPYNGNTNFTWQSPRPIYLRNLRSAPVANIETINMGARTINGSKWDHMVPTFTLSPDGVQEFRIKGATNHPFHLHVYHVQVQAACGDFEAGEYYDVVAGNCTVRFDLSPETAYAGRTVMHCHILEHEDQGAMGWADVLGGTPPPVFPDVTPAYDDYIPAAVPPGTPPVAPSGLSATAVSSSQIDLTWSDQSDNESIFQIDRSTDGTNFSPRGTANTNATTWSDTNLSAAT
ncbi:MAG: multicopper oxidase domain-containing protein, partial [Lysobacterales bacterium]